MSLVDDLWVQPKRRRTSDDPVEEALRKALEATTPEHAGTPWDGEEEVERRPRGYWLPGGD